MDKAVFEGIGRALKSIYRCEAADGMPERWRALLAQLDAKLQPLATGSGDPEGASDAANPRI